MTVSPLALGPGSQVRIKRVGHSQCQWTLVLVQLCSVPIVFTLMHALTLHKAGYNDGAMDTATQ